MDMDAGMGEDGWLAERFEQQRPHLRSVAYRMLGSLTEADDALQDAWVRVNRAGAEGVDNVGGWLTTIVARVCLTMLRSRQTRREEAWDTLLPDPIISRLDAVEPEDEAILADSVGLALLVVLETLAPAERLAFVLHDLFGLPFEEIAPMVGRTPTAARQLASRARRRVKGADVDAAGAETDVGRQREVVDAFFAAARGGDMEALINILDPDVVLHSDFGPGRPAASSVVRGAAEVAKQARLGATPVFELHPALINGGAGMVISRRGRPAVVMAFTVARGRIVEIDVFGDPERVRRVAGAVLEEG
jgi:RNA polymerase sigma factor (sigma-70 family)